MSKRYGRNQKRRHREEIARLIHLVDLTEADAREAECAKERYAARIMAWANRIRRVCGDDHPFNEAIRQKLVRHVPRSHNTLRSAPPPMSMAEAIRWSAGTPYEQAASYIDCAVHELTIRQRPPEGIAGAIFELVGPDGSSALAVDCRALLEALDDPEFERWVARRLVEHLKGQRGEMRKPKAA